MFSQGERANPWEPQESLMDREYWLQIHESFIRQTTVRKNDIKIVFIGASIVQNWCSEGRHIWTDYYEPKGAVNYGIGGDTIQNVLWRVENGVLDGLQPQVVVIQCGTNNIEPYGPPSDNDIAKGISHLVARVREKCPESKVILCSIFPINETLYQTKANRINEKLAKNGDDLNVFFLDLFANMTDSNGKQKRGVFSDGLHLSYEGYNVWHQGLRPLFDQLLS